MKTISLRLVLALLISILFTVAHCDLANANDDDRPHVVVVVGTLHYSPELTMPVFAKELERFGFRTTVVMGEGDPEKKTEDVLPGIEALADADLAIFFMRFLNLPDKEWQPIEDYLKSGKPVVGLRTANHSFKYPKDHPRFSWNDDFGRLALGTPYIVHQRSTTKISVVEKALDHAIMTNVTKKNWVSPGTLYLTRLEEGCVPLVAGSGTGRARTLKKAFGTIEVKPNESDVVAWTWQNQWGGKVFGTSFGHPGDFAEESFVRMLVNAVHWSVDRPMPGAAEKVSTWKIERVDKKKRTPKQEKAKQEKAKQGTTKTNESGSNKQPTKNNSLPGTSLPVAPTPSPTTSLEDPTSAQLTSQSPIRAGDRIAFVGNTFADQLRIHGYLENLLTQHTRGNPVSVRNLGWGGDMLASRDRPTGFPTEESTLKEHQTDVIVACFGMGESFAGQAGLEEFKSDLKTFIDSHAGKRYNDKSDVRLILVSPIACEDLGDLTPQLDQRNRDLKIYTQAMKDVAQDSNVPFVDLLKASNSLMAENSGPKLTSNGIHLNPYGYWAISHAFFDQLTAGGTETPRSSWLLKIDADAKTVSARGVGISDIVTDKTGFSFLGTQTSAPQLPPPLSLIHI